MLYKCTLKQFCATYLIWDPTALFTPYSIVHFEKLTVAQLVKNFHAFYGTRRFIALKVTAFVMRHCAFWKKFEGTCYLYFKRRYTAGGVSYQETGASDVVHFHLYISQLAEYILSQMNPVVRTSSPVCLKTILKLSSHLRQSFVRGVCPSVFLTKILYIVFSLPPVSFTFI